jgi:DNA-directed RNA polymerase specialized sigma24 family protein
MADRPFRLRAADRRLVEAVLVEHARYIESAAAGVAPTPDLVPDIMQEVAVRVCRSFEQLRERSGPGLRTYLWRTTTRVGFDLRRREDRLVARNESYADSRERLALSPEEELLTAE